MKQARGIFIDIYQALANRETRDSIMHHARLTTRILTAVFSIGFILPLCNQSGLAAKEDGAPTRIHVDPGHVVARSVDRKLGIGLNFTIDRNDRTLRNALQKLGVSAIRFQEGELGDNWHFDAADPARPVLGVTDPKIWYHRSKTDGKRWLSTLTPADFLDLAATQQLDAYSIVGIDTLVYDGSAPHLSRTEVIASAEAFVRFAGETADRLQRPQPVIKYWEIGNENDLQGMLGQFKLGHTWKAAEYAQLAAELATRMKRADARILIGVNGMTPKSDWWHDVLTSEVTVAGQSRRLVELIRLSRDAPVFVGRQLQAMARCRCRLGLCPQCGNHSRYGRTICAGQTDRGDRMECLQPESERGQGPCKQRLARDSQSADAGGNPETRIGNACLLLGHPLESRREQTPQRADP